MHWSKATGGVIFWTAVVLLVSHLADNSGGYGLQGLSAKILRPS